MELVEQDSNLIMFIGVKFTFDIGIKYLYDNFTINDGDMEIIKEAIDKEKTMSHFNEVCSSMDLNKLSIRCYNKNDTQEVNDNLYYKDCMLLIGVKVPTIEMNSFSDGDYNFVEYDIGRLFVYTQNILKQPVQLHVGGTIWG